ncbi:peptidase [Colletotrichum truncatum]|uniref:Peptidase n=1 Tax=Colletotrichum truncatum TaxID=5467 RepID=A0ACC3YNM2_COLTU|nr:peptidase [Colletotrichum truncatum]KAF6780608.1 peptidase [Colletotrichum truncatum]
MTRVNLLHERNLTGKGVRVAIIDGGVDYLHPALGQGFGDGHQVQYGWDFVGDNVKPPNKEQPDDDPYGDCSNHATHTAGILFAQDVDGKTGFRGVAPGVTVEHYRVFDCNGMSTGDVVVRAVLRAYERGVDLINLSLGSGSKPFSDGMFVPQNGLSGCSFGPC